MQSWSHPVLTKGSPVVLRKLNLRGLRAVVQKQVDMKRGNDADALGKVDIFVVLAYETLRRSLPDVTVEQILDALEVDEMKQLSDAIVAANPDLAKRAAEVSQGNANAS